MVSTYAGPVPFSRRRNRRHEHYYTDQAILSSLPRTILKSMLLPDERVLQFGIISNGIYWKSIAMMLVGFVVLLFALVMGIFWLLISLVGLFLVLNGLFMFTWAYLTQQYLLLAATNKRVIMRFGVLNLEVAQMNYSKIESSEVFSSLIGRYLGYASIIISGTGGHNMVIPYVENALTFRNIVNEVMLNREDLAENNVVVAQAVPIAADNMAGSIPNL